MNRPITNRVFTARGFAAASITSVPHSIAAAASPSIAGYLLGLRVFGWPLVAAGATKIVYDAARAARQVDPAHRRAAAHPSNAVVSPA